METQREKSISRLQYFACFLLTFIYRFAYILGPAQMRVTYDDIGILCGPASLAGCNWLGTMHYIKYYGQSLSVLLTPIFLIGKGNPTLVWYLVEMTYLAIAAAGAVILLYIGKKFFKVGNSWIYVFFAVISTLAFEPNNDMSNEPALYLASILLVLFLLKMFNETKRSKIILLQILSLLAIMFGHLANSRGMVFWVVLPVVYLWILWKYKGKQMGYWYIWIPGLVLSYLASNEIRDWVILKLWNVNLAAGEAIINTSVEVSFDKIIEMLSCKSGIKVFLMSVFGGIYGGSIHSYGALLFMILVPIILLFTAKRQENESAIEIASLVGLGCFLVGLIGVSTSTLYGEGMWEDLQNNRVTIAFDALYYYRYYASFIAPGLFAAMCFIPKHVNERRKRMIICASAAVMLLFLTIFNYVYVFDFAKMYDECRQTAMYPYVLKSVEDVGHQFLICFIIMIVFLALYVLCVCTDRNWYMGIAIALLCILPIIFASNPSPYKALFNDHCDTGFNLVRYMERIPEAEDLGDTLYLAGESKTVINYQYALMEYKISEDIPQKEDIIVFANNNDSLLDDSYEWIQLDSNESVYVKGKYSEIVKQFLQHRN